MLPQSDRLGRKSSIVQGVFSFKPGPIFTNREAFSLFLKIVGELQLRSRSPIIMQPILDLFVLDPNFEKITSQFTKSIFEEIISIINCTKSVLTESGLLEDEADSFKAGFDRKKVRPLSTNDQKTILYAKNVSHRLTQTLEYYKNQIIFCKNVIIEQRVNERDHKSSELKRYLKKKIPAIVASVIELFESERVRYHNSGHTLGFSRVPVRDDEQAGKEQSVPDHQGYPAPGLQSEPALQSVPFSV